MSGNVLVVNFYLTAFCVCSILYISEVLSMRVQSTKLLVNFMAKILLFTSYYLLKDLLVKSTFLCKTIKLILFSGSPFLTSVSGRFILNMLCDFVFVELSFYPIYVKEVLACMTQTKGKKKSK